MGCERKNLDMSQRPEDVSAEPIPECDEFGYYGPVRCKNGTFCHCQDREGNRIFGTAPYDQRKDMNCCE